MTWTVEPPQADGTAEGALMALVRLESTSNAIRVRISRLAPDQLYRTVTDEQPIVELISQAVDRERAYLDAFRQIVTQTNPQLEEPRPGVPYLDRDFSEDLAEFFDLRRET